MGYRRVMPRDLFNEAKLLKCLGQVALILHDNGRYNIELVHRRPEMGFLIEQREGSTDLYCRNLNLRIKGCGRWIKLSSVYGSKAPYPLLYEIGWGDDIIMGDVFNDDGKFSAEFLELIAKTGNTLEDVTKNHSEGNEDD